MYLKKIKNQEKRDKTTRGVLWIKYNLFIFIER